MSMTKRTLAVELRQRLHIEWNVIHEMISFGISNGLMSYDSYVPFELNWTVEFASMCNFDNEECIRSLIDNFSMEYRDAITFGNGILRGNYSGGYAHPN